MTVQRIPPKPAGPCPFNLTLCGAVFYCVKARGHRSLIHRIEGPIEFVGLHGLQVTLESAIEWTETP